MKEIRYEFTALELISACYPESYVLPALRRAGMPLNGFFIFRGVERGTLTTWSNIERNTEVFVWRDKE